MRFDLGKRVHRKFLFRFKFLDIEKFLASNLMMIVKIYDFLTQLQFPEKKRIYGWKSGDTQEEIKIIIKFVIKRLLNYTLRKWMRFLMNTKTLNAIGIYHSNGVQKNVNAKLYKAKIALHKIVLLFFQISHCFVCLSSQMHTIYNLYIIFPRTSLTFFNLEIYDYC